MIRTHYNVMAHLTDEQEQRLRKLAAFLMTVDTPRFDMAQYVTLSDAARGSLLVSHGHSIGGYAPGLYTVAKHPEIFDNCGTAACAVGWAAHIFRDDWIDEIKYESHSCGLLFSTLAEHLFGSVLGEFHSSHAFNWVASGAWSKYDNTALGAAHRILYMLDYGVPEQFDCDDTQWDHYVSVYTKWAEANAVAIEGVTT